MVPIFMLVLVSLVAFETGDAGRPIACYLCDSHYDLSCAAPFNNMTQHLFRCPQGQNKCSVTIQREMVAGHEIDRFIRACADQGEVLQSNSCLMGDTNSEGAQTCYCDYRDGCNQDHISIGALLKFKLSKKLTPSS